MFIKAVLRLVKNSIFFVFAEIFSVIRFVFMQITGIFGTPFRFPGSIFL